MQEKAGEGGGGGVGEGDWNNNFAYIVLLDT